MDNKENNSPLSGESAQAESAEEVLNKYVKGDLKRDYDQRKLDYNTIYISSTLKAMEEYATPLKSSIAELERENEHLQEYKEQERLRRSNFATRIAQLEAENAKLREALKGIAWLKFCSSIHPHQQGDAAIKIAEQALKGKEAKDE